MTALASDSRILVSIIVPARNEEASLAACLQSLVAQTEVSFEIIVVNDHSTDRTAEIAQSFANIEANRVKVIDAPALPEGWVGKNYALFTGAKQAAGFWLLFTDADTVHLPNSLSKAIAEAEKNSAQMLSYSPEQEVRSFWEKALMPVVFAELASRYHPKDISDPTKSAAAANGQYILITRKVYDSIGGHAAIAGNILEDVMLASIVKKAGHKIFFRYTNDIVRTRMYRSFPQMREGWTKNLFLLFRASTKKLAALRFAEFFSVLAGVTGTVLFALRSLSTAAILSAILTLALYFLFLRRIRKAHFQWDANLCAFFGLPIFSYLLLRSALLHKRGKIQWKGRIYPAQPLPQPPEIRLSETSLHPR